MSDFIDGLTLALVYLMALALSWGIVLLVSLLITLCFGMEWSVLFGTGVWLCCFLLRFATLHSKSNVELDL